MTLKSVMESDLDVFFNSDELAEAVTLNGAAATAMVIDEGHDEDGRWEFDFVDLAFQLSEYSTVSYDNDTVVYAGETWAYPKRQSVDGDTMIVRFRCNAKPIRLR